MENIGMVSHHIIEGKTHTHKTYAHMTKSDLIKVKLARSNIRASMLCMFTFN